MLEVQTTREIVTLSFNRDFLSTKELSTLIENLRIKELLLKSKLQENQVLLLDEELKNSWWKKNREKILKKIK